MRINLVLPFLLLVTHAQCVSAQQRSTNFAADDIAVVKAAEAARVQSAIFWSNTDLPGDWYRPCPITVRTAAHSGGGVTQFRFHNGEVCDWSMTVEGTREAIINDVIPHEVDHMVRASLVRKPIVRWLDEGCASFMESETAKTQLRDIARSLDESLINEQFLNGRDYPSDPQQLRELYALGFSLVELLLDRNGPQTLLKLQQSHTDILTTLQQHYDLSLSELQSLWEKSLRRSPIQLNLRPITCQCQQRPDNLLIIWGAHWCSPCRQFWNDYHRHAKFREALNQKFHIHFHDFDQQRPLAIQQQITGVPTFIVNGKRITGYTSKENFLRELAIHFEPKPAQVVPARIPQEQLDPPAITPEQTVPIPSERTSPKSLVAPVESSPPPVPQAQSNVAQDSRPKVWTDMKRVLIHFVPIGFTALQWTGLLGGTFATGGIGALALTVFFRRLARKHPQPESITRVERRSIPTPAPFPRQLDEARQLLKLRQSEGRVGLLDALRGMFLDDELEKMTHTQSPELNEALKQLRTNINARVDEVAPLSTTLND